MINTLRQLGCRAISTKMDGYAPLVIKGPFTKNYSQIEGQDSQPVSALLIAAAFAPQKSTIEVLNPGEKPWIDLTLSWFDRLGIQYGRKDYRRFELEGRTQLDAFTYSVPGDFSSAAFPIAAALVTNSELTIENLDLDDAQGDKKIISILEQMGALFEIQKDKKQLVVKSGCKLKGMRIDIDDCIDALPILSVIGCFAEGKTELYNGFSARNKESDRISSIKLELEKMGAIIEEKESGLTIHQTTLHGASVKSHNDHRILFSLAVAALAAKGHTAINGIECGAKTIPSFLEDFQSIGANIERDFIRL